MPVNSLRPPRGSLPCPPGPPRGCRLRALAPGALWNTNPHPSWPSLGDLWCLISSPADFYLLRLKHHNLWRETAERRQNRSQAQTPGGTRRCPLPCSPRSFPQVSASPEPPSPPPGRTGLGPAVLGAAGVRRSGAVLRRAPPPRPCARPAKRAAHRLRRALGPPRLLPSAPPPRLRAVPPRRAAPPFPAPRPRRAPGRFSAQPPPPPPRPEVRAAPQPRSANAGSARSPAPSASPQPK